jgi:iron complex transport system ATP-binding protein
MTVEQAGRKADFAFAAWKQARLASLEVVVPSAAPQPILEVRRLRIVREDKVILRGLSWRVEPGQHWVVLGPNGSGKSSLLAALTGYFAPTAGSLAVLGETFGRSDWRELRRRIGLVGPSVAAMIRPDEPALAVVAGGVDGLINLWRRPKPATLARARRLLRLLKVGGLAARPWGHLSQGERQRVLIARALSSEPALLILDEACAGLDPVARAEFLALVRRLPKLKRGLAIVFVTHHVEEILPTFTHALLLRHGSVLAAGKTAEVLRPAALSKLFGRRVRLVRRRDGWSLGVSAK